MANGQPVEDTAGVSHEILERLGEWNQQLKKS